MLAERGVARQVADAALSKETTAALEAMKLKSREEILGSSSTAGKLAEIEEKWSEIQQLHVKAENATVSGFKETYRNDIVPNPQGTAGKAGEGGATPDKAIRAEGNWYYADDYTPTTSNRGTIHDTLQEK